MFNGLGFAITLIAVGMIGAPILILQLTASV